MDEGTNTGDNKEEKNTELIYKERERNMQATRFDEIKILDSLCNITRRRNFPEQQQAYPERKNQYSWTNHTNQWPRKKVSTQPIDQESNERKQGY